MGVAAVPRWGVSSPAMNPVSGSIPFATLSGSQQVVRTAASAAARASYGASPSAATGPTTGPLGRIGPVTPARAAETATQHTPAIPSSPTADTDRLVGARVNKGIDFEVGGASDANRVVVSAGVNSTTPMPGPPKPVSEFAFPMYRHPADRHAAATAVNVGRSIDVTG